MEQDYNPNNIQKIWGLSDGYRAKHMHSIQPIFCGRMLWPVPSGFWVCSCTAFLPAICRGFPYPSDQPRLGWCDFIWDGILPSLKAEADTDLFAYGTGFFRTRPLTNRTR